MIHLLARPDVLICLRGTKHAPVSTLLARDRLVPWAHS
jgi:hypothetical protein